MGHRRLKYRLIVIANNVLNEILDFQLPKNLCFTDIGFFNL